MRIGSMILEWRQRRSLYAGQILIGEIRPVRDGMWEWRRSDAFQWHREPSESAARAACEQHFLTSVV